jgi:hypothetical protein
MALEKPVIRVSNFVAKILMHMHILMLEKKQCDLTHYTKMEISHFVWYFILHPFF